jgi:hypothetical protein
MCLNERTIINLGVAHNLKGRDIEDNAAILDSTDRRINHRGTRGRPGGQGGRVREIGCQLDRAKGWWSQKGGAIFRTGRRAHSLPEEAA